MSADPNQLAIGVMCTVGVFIGTVQAIRAWQIWRRDHR